MSKKSRPGKIQRLFWKEQRRRQQIAEAAASGTELSSEAANLRDEQVQDQTQREERASQGADSARREPQQRESEYGQHQSSARTQDLIIRTHSNKTKKNRTHKYLRRRAQDVERRVKMLEVTTRNLVDKFEQKSAEIEVDLVHARHLGKQHSNAEVKWEHMEGAITAIEVRLAKLEGELGGIVYKTSEGIAQQDAIAAHLSGLEEVRHAVATLRSDVQQLRDGRNGGVGQQRGGNQEGWKGRLRSRTKGKKG